MEGLPNPGRKGRCTYRYKSSVLISCNPWPREHPSQDQKGFISFLRQTQTRALGPSHMRHKHYSFIHPSVNIYSVPLICQTKSLPSWNLLPPIVFFYSYWSPLFKPSHVYPSTIVAPTLIYPKPLCELWLVYSSGQKHSVISQCLLNQETWFTHPTNVYCVSTMCQALF